MYIQTMFFHFVSISPNKTTYITIIIIFTKTLNFNKAGIISLKMEHSNKTSTNICSECGSRIPTNANKCLVCGKKVSSSIPKAKITSRAPVNKISGRGMPVFNVSPGILLIAFAIFFILGGGIAYNGIKSLNIGGGIEDKPTQTPSPTGTQVILPTLAPPTNTFTPQPSRTPLSYTVIDGDTCLGLSARFNISQQTLILINNLSSSCILPVNAILTIPQATFTPTPIASGTPSNLQLTVQSCEIEQYTVVAGDDIKSISEEFKIPQSEIILWNGISSESVFPGARINLPLCKQNFPESAGNTPVPTPFYRAPNLLLPQNGESFNLINDTISLQWSGVGTLKIDEFYQLVIVDLSLENDTQNPSIVTTKSNSGIYTTDFRPTDGSTHIYQWTVSTVRVISQDENGDLIYQSAGSSSNFGYFSWSNTTP
jgi:LysM repeat protein/ribosomal protein L40E